MKFNLILLLFLLNTFSVFATDYYFQRITKDSDFSFGPVNALCEDKDGLIWFGCDNGLYFHDTSGIKKARLLPSSEQNSQSIQINHLYKDPKNGLWVCSEKGLFKLNSDSNEFEQKVNFDTHKNEKLRVQNMIHVMDDTYLIQGNKQLLLYHEGKDSLSLFKKKFKSKISFLKKEEKVIYIGCLNGDVLISKDDLKTLTLLYKTKKNHPTSICRDGNKYYISFLHGGLDITNLQGVQIKEFGINDSNPDYLNNTRIHEVCKRKHSEIWVATDRGVVVINQDKQTLLHSREETGIPNRYVFSLLKGKNDNIWIGTFAGGVACFSDYNYAFKHKRIDHTHRSDVRSTASVFCEDQYGMIWIGNEDNGKVRMYNPTSDDYSRVTNSDLYSKSENVKSICNVGNNHLAFGRGFKKDLIVYDYKNKLIEEEVELPLVSDGGIIALTCLENKIYASGRRRVVSFDKKTKKMEEIFTLKDPAVGRIWYLYLDSTNNLWICTDHGLYVKRKGVSKAEECILNNQTYDLSDETIYTICEDNEGLMWLGTKGRGVYVYSLENNSIRLAPQYHLAHYADIHSLIKDNKGNIWYNTNQGLYQYQVNLAQTKHFGTVDGLSGEHIRPNSMFCTSTGKLMIGAINGFDIIDPQKIRSNPHTPKVFLTEISINNTPIKDENIESIDRWNLRQATKLVLNHEQNTLKFCAISNNYIKASKNRLKYRLINYDNNWVEIPQNKEIIYTKIPPGKFVLEIYGSNNSNIWSDEPLRFDIEIMQPLYNRWYAWLLYLFLFGGFTFGIIREINSKITLRKQMVAERERAEINEKWSEERMKFFTNISHEIRTPLTLIISPLKSLIEKHKYDEKSLYLLETVERNSKRLLKITDQALDIRLLELNELKPNFQKTNLMDIVDEVYHCFEEKITSKKIDFNMQAGHNKIELLIDGDMIEKVIYNLMSNAIKYTEEGGKINMSIQPETLNESFYHKKNVTGKKIIGNVIAIEVKDTGKGIKSSLLPFIYKRFTKDDESRQISTGIGLHLSKEYTEMNEGNIVVESEENKGSKFTLHLPVTDKSGLKQGNYREIVQLKTNNELELDESVTIHGPTRSTILLTEDNDELRIYFKKMLSSYYKVITAKSGEQTLDILKNVTPDVLITDVSMPGMSGIDLTKIMKSTSDTEDIPIIVITAHAERQVQMESILYGADAFLTKPVEETMLLVQIKNILAKKNMKPKPQTVMQTINQPEDFLSKVEQIICDNFNNPQFGIGDLLTEMKISKSTLDRKIKAETHLNPSAYIREVRLKNAIKLLSSNNFNIDEIAAYVGFNSTSYFIRTFKSKFGVTPTEYRKINTERRS